MLGIILIVIHSAYTPGHHCAADIFLKPLLLNLNHQGEQHTEQAGV